MVTARGPVGAVLPDPGPGAAVTTSPGREVSSGRNSAVTVLQVYVVTLIALPNDIGLPGVPGLNPPTLVALFGLLLWFASVALGSHHPTRHPNPTRFSLLALWLATSLAFVAMQFTSPTADQMAGSTRWLLQLAAWTGVIVLAADFLRTQDEVLRILRTLTWAGAVMGLVALVQYQFRIDLATYLRYVPGFVEKAAGYTAIGERGGKARVAGTALHPIELGVTAATILPLAIVAALRAKGRWWWIWGPVALTAVPLVVSLSRSAVIALAVSFGFLIVCLAPAQRLVALGAGISGLFATFALAPGALGTLVGSFTGAAADSSVQKRQLQAPIVERLVAEHPWFGRGGGTLVPATRYTNIVFNNIYDNQYFGMAIEFGLVGVALITVGYLLLPPVVAVVARGRSTDPDLRLMAGALAGAAAVAVPTAYTFDSFGFPKAAGMQALAVGLIGAVWCLVRIERTHGVDRDRNDGTLNRSHLDHLDPR
ncbi:MAG: O-antigen ligase family protein [Microthrixaceae bacterium]